MELAEAVKQLDEVRRQKDEAIAAREHERAAQLRDQELKLQVRIEKLEEG